MPKPFEEFNLNRQILNAVADAGFTVATPIQEKAIAPVLSGQDIFGIAETGTGKTAAYVLPILMQLKYAQGDAPRALILAPTRELAMQIAEHVKIFSKYTDLRSVVVFGGIGPKTQIEQIKAGVDIIIATPGRFLDIYLAGHINTQYLKFLVLDEADKMMDMGFIGSIHRILEVVPRKRQNLLFSATMSDLVHKIAGDFLKNPTIIEVGQQATPAQTVTQGLYEVPNFKTKINLLQHLLKNEIDFKRLIIFCKTKTVADNIFSFIERRYGASEVRVIHANKGQNTRINSINSFKEGHIRVLVATDVASRGIDVAEVSHVINFDVPIIIEDYVHRIGRTGRAYAKGDALTFCTEAEKYYIKKIEKLMRQTIPVMELPKEVFVEETPYEERQYIAREIDNQKRKDDPDFKGAFHEKKHAAAIAAAAAASAKKKMDKTPAWKKRKFKKT
ncbi:ATP-dependent RNA helicase RhlE [Pedobacter cryoconitis]|uniref:DEAD/DEAH box helicase n=1 Tax=Pedobacter cryoconitis TaxID=188932 RepID=UPI00161B1713|nr:DEAD/DEAH box helicase [Pedobacter cryoconitis]MBB6269647.1 ATP-dependent RNA helicase RhlE [Pedobacter cryoconitis]